jgi:pimeloyl-ACP methyl ester carboxylesterase
LSGLTDGGFKSGDARHRYLAAYDELRGLSPRPDIVHDVPTKFGIVRVYQHGPDRGVPIVLIHGFFLTSAMWWGQVAGLTSVFTVYAMDMLGQPGASVQTKTMFTPADSASCIDAVLEGLKLPTTRHSLSTRWRVRPPTRFR